MMFWLNFYMLKLPDLKHWFLVMILANLVN
jgi:hypothetical protein